MYCSNSFPNIFIHVLFLNHDKVEVNNCENFISLQFRTLQAMMSKLPGYSSNGSIHLITNNLIGFTAQDGAQSSSFTAGDIGL